MRIKDIIAELSQYDENIELVVNVDGKCATPSSMKKDIVHFKHDYSGTVYTDEAVVLSARI
jgi:hypothetical protein